MKYETRATGSALEISEQGFGGLGALYYDGTPATEARIAPDLRERFMPGCFRDCYARGDDIVSFFNHDERVMLGRRSSGLKLTEDERGLSYFVPLDPSDPDHVRVIAKIRRGDVRGSSIIFGARAEDQRFSKSSDGGYIREILAATVLEIGPTPFPVYPGTTAEARSRSIEDLIAEAKANCVDPPTEYEFALYSMLSQ